MDQHICNQPGCRFNQFVIVWALQEVLSVFVGFPGCVENACQQAFSICGEKCPELAWLVQSIEGYGPPDGDLIEIIRGSSITLRVRGQLMDPFPDCPLGYASAVVEISAVFFVGQSNYPRRLLVVSLQNQTSDVLDEQQKFSREFLYLILESLMGSRL